MGTILGKKRLWVYVAIVAAGLTSGATLGWTCDGYYCQESVDFCVPLGEFTQDSCCVEGYCMECTRERYLCDGGSSTRPGPAYDCHSPGAPCN